ncbi:MAG: nucleotidyl transferase AbiEii/AbiGii toxin family protein, partial [Woeseiaceae bacterium]
MDHVAIWNPEERADLFREVAARMGPAPEIIEKDFWVCWTLSRLFGKREGFPTMLFKGGTSLSKAHGLIERFSEDIDLSLDRADLGFTGDRDPASEMSGKSRRKLVTELQLTCADYVGTGLLPSLIRDFESVLGTAGETWRLDIDSEDPQTLLFAYPNGLTSVPESYNAPVVRLEFGARSDLWPATDAEIRPYAAEHVPEAFEGAANCTVHVLAAKRTFWEKATLLHAEFHRSEVRPGAEKLSRHYYDLAMLATTPVFDEALSDLELLSSVAEHKTQFFPAAWARYDLAKPGSLRLVPHQALAKMLARDYEAMKEM